MDTSMQNEASQHPNCLVHRPAAAITSRPSNDTMMVEVSCVLPNAALAEMLSILGSILALGIGSQSCLNEAGRGLSRFLLRNCHWQCEQ